MAFKIGFIGAGRMAGAMIGGLISRGVCSPGEIVACAPGRETREMMVRKHGIAMYRSAAEIAPLCDVLVLAVKPGSVPALFEEEKLVLSDRHLLVSVVAGLTFSALRSYVPDARIVRVMPNHCCMVLEGASGFAMGPGCRDGDREVVGRMLSAVGLAVETAEGELDAVTGVSGSSPAFLYMACEGIIKAGIAHGLTEGQATRLAAQSMVGAGRMVLESGMGTGPLIDGVCSPGGTTVEGVKVLMNRKFGEAVSDAVEASIARSMEISRGMESEAAARRTPEDAEGDSRHVAPYRPRRPLEVVLVGDGGVHQPHALVLDFPQAGLPLLRIPDPQDRIYLVHQLPRGLGPLVAGAGVLL